jgi:hypothetical protein
VDFLDFGHGDREHPEGVVEPEGLLVGEGEAAQVIEGFHVFGRHAQLVEHAAVVFDVFIDVPRDLPEPFGLEGAQGVRIQVVVLVHHPAFRLIQYPENPRVRVRPS